MAFFGKRYKRVKVLNLEEFMEATETPTKMRESYRRGAGVHIFNSNPDGSYTHVLDDSSDNKMETKFQLGQEVEQPRADGAVMKVKYDLNGNTLTQTLKYDEKLTLTYVRQFEGDTMTMTVSAENVKESVISYYETV